MQVIASDPLALLVEVRAWFKAGNWYTSSTEGKQLTLAVRHGVAGLFAGDSNQHVALRRRHLELTTYAAQISRALAEGGVSHAVLRGPVSAAMYPQPGVRWYSDLDFLVSTAGLDRLRAILGGLGLSQGTVDARGVRPPTALELAREPSEKRLHAFIGAEPLHDGKYLVVEIHHGLRPPYVEAGAPAAQLLDGVTWVAAAETGTTLPVLAPLDRAVELCVHVESKATHLPALRAGRDLRLGLYADLALLLAQSGVSVLELVDHARGLGYGESAERATDLCAAVLSDDAPEPELLVRYFTQDGQYQTVAQVVTAFADRLMHGSSVSDLRWLVPQSAFDETAVLHAHTKGNHSE